MEISADTARPVQLVLPATSERRIIALTLGAAWLIFGILFDLHIGFARLQSWFSAWPISALVSQAVLMAGVALPPCIMYFFRPRLEFGSGRIRLIASRADKTLVGVGDEELVLPATTLELRLCHMFPRGKLPTYRIIASDSNGNERWIGGKETNTRISLWARERTRLMDALRRETGLPVRAVTRREEKDGTISEIPWEPTRSKNRSFIALISIAGALPFASGVAMGALGATPTMAIYGGLASWTAVGIAVAAYGNRVKAKKISYLSYLATVVPFSATYAVSYVVSNYMRQGH